MATQRDWADGYLAQARADLVGARLVGAAEPSVFAMMMQMAFEKFAKAALLRTGAITLESAQASHRAASTMVAVMRRQRGLMAPMGGPLVWHAAFDVVEALERAQPSVARGNNAAKLEYPWETTAGAIQWPARDLAIVANLGNPRSNLIAHVGEFAFRLNRHFDSIFP